MAFSALSLPSQRLSVSPSDLWPTTSVGWHPLDHRLTLTATHHHARITVTVIPGTPEIPSSLSLWWATTTASLPALEHKSLRDHCPGLHWAPFREDFQSFVAWAASASSTQRSSAHLEACYYTAAFDDLALRSLGSEDFVAALV